MKKHISKLKIVSAFFLLIILGMAILLLRNYKTEQEKLRAEEEQLKNIISQGRAEDSLKRKVFSFLDEVRADAEYDEKVYDNWLRILALDEYDGIQINMWDPDTRCEEWYYKYFAKNVKSIGYNVKSAEKITGFLRAAMNSDNNVEKVVIYIDPYVIWKNYEKRFVFNAEGKLTFPQELRIFLLSIIAEYPDVDFRVNLPEISANEWLSYDQRTRDAMLGVWAECIQYCSWYQNVTIHSMGTEKWLAFNPDNFDKGKMKPDVSETVFAYENTPSFAIDDETVAEVFADFSRTLEKTADGQYATDRFKDYRAVFFGDSIFRRTEVDSLAISGLFSALSGADCYNLAIMGTTMSSGKENSFAEVTAAIKEGRVLGQEGYSTVSEGNRFLADKASDRKTVFFVEYGFNDYVQGVSAKDFATGFTEGINNIKAAYPNSIVVVVSPLHTDYGNYGKDKNGENGSTISGYIKAEEKAVSDMKDVYFVNFFDKWKINAENSSKYLLDGVHPTYSGNLIVAEGLVEELSAILEK
ncbi:MAG: SGNH/GDSL hydrolase family protein [Lachnospiraceae bacterium]|nr:SGNH/GDSL hydrolase family protein [Lachnospiraceae bacterium]